MANLTRRSFLAQASAGAVIAGAAVTAPSLFTGAQASASPRPTGSSGPIATTDGPVVAYLKDASSGNISILVGSREIQYQDPHLASVLAGMAR
ncbi:MAG: hypothetical protein ACRD0I_08690 [Acidimicrobiales bacterium]